MVILFWQRLGKVGTWKEEGRSGYNESSPEVEMLRKFMVVSLPPDLERLVQRQVESGKYTT